MDFDPVGVVLTAQAGGGASPPPAWVSNPITPRPCRGRSLEIPMPQSFVNEPPLQGGGCFYRSPRPSGGEAPPPAWAVRTTPTGSKSKPIPLRALREKTRSLVPLSLPSRGAFHCPPRTVAQTQRSRNRMRVTASEEVIWSPSAKCAHGGTNGNGAKSAERIYFL